jgi:anionic cell wall polymer biosynthesis LytR-Cps2A-Psr (LCP) family protein
MHYDDNWGDLHIHLEQGRHKLDGYEAMGFIRYRKSDSDFKRMERQRDLMLAFKQAIFSNPSVLPSVTEKSAEVMGGAFQPNELAALATFIQRVKSDQIKLGTVPVLDGSNYNLLLDGASLESVLEKHYLREPSAQTASTTSGGNL